MRRSIIAVNDLKAGDILSADDLDVKRPGTGFPQKQLQTLLAKEFVEMLVETL